LALKIIELFQEFKSRHPRLGFRYLVARLKELDREVAEPPV
jgi:hypothetical protein